MANEEPLAVDVATTEVALPPVIAVYLVVFDNRKGYTLAWHKSLPHVELEGSVEFKSLPSGVHNVSEDLVYFIHEDSAGISAFQNKPDANAARKASMLAVGVLVPLEHGRMGKSWRHAESIKELARKQIEDVNGTTALEEYWEKYRLEDGDHHSASPPADSPSDNVFDKQNGNSNDGYQKSRSMSLGTIFQSSNHYLTPHHPALALTTVLKLFGPLIFPLYRASLLRQRVLFVSEAPVEFSCNLVYNLSILSSIPKALLELLPIEGTPDRRLRPLFSVGVQDIPLLQNSKTPESANFHNEGWIACTTDDVLSTKPELFDLLVLLPGANIIDAKRKVYPKLVLSSPDLARSFPKIGGRATQRDASRYNNLSQSLKNFPKSKIQNLDSEELQNKSVSVSSKASSVMSNKLIVEAPSWSQVAYTSLVWWATAGDRRTGLNEAEEAERERDSAMLWGEGEEDETKEIALVAYFHELTNLIFTTLSTAITRADGEEEQNETYHDEVDENHAPNTEGSENEHFTGNGEVVIDEQGESQALLSDEPVEITQDDISAMGLDVWSATDRRFVEQMLSIWWGRQAVVRGGTIECCGIRIL